MPRRQMTWSENLVGRRLPKEPPYIDQLMAGFVKSDGTFCARSEPADSWMRPAFRKAKKNGWLRLQSRMRIMSGRPFGIYQLTDRGREAALAAHERVTRSREERHHRARCASRRRPLMQERFHLSIDYDDGVVGSYRGVVAKSKTAEHRWSTGDPQADWASYLAWASETKPLMLESSSITHFCWDNPGWRFVENAEGHEVLVSEDRPEWRDETPEV